VQLIKLKISSASFQSTMAPWENFDQVFSFNKKYAYEPKVFDQIIANRRSLDKLFADRLLELFGIQGGTVNRISELVAAC